MKSRWAVLAVAVVALSSLLAFPAAARGRKSPPLEPGKYKTWGPDIDEVEILVRFRAGDYDTLAVARVDTSETPLPDEKEKARQSVSTVLASYAELLTAALRDELKGRKVVQVADEPKSERVLILRAKVIELDPGSRGARMMVGYGAGGAANAISGELVDAGTGKVLVRFTQRRRSAGTFKFAGGSDVQVMRDGIHAIGEDIASLIEAFR